MYYTSTEEARSDLFLAAGWFVIGPFILGALLDVFRLNRIGSIRPFLVVALPLVYTVLVPLLLIRYRREPLSAYGTRGGVYALGLGVVLGIPVVLATAILTVISSSGNAVFPDVLSADVPLLWLLARLALWVGMALLGVYITVKARDAFAGYSLTLREGIIQVGRILALVAAAATVLLLLGVFAGTVNMLWYQVLLGPLSMAAVVFAAMRTVRGPSVTTRATLVAPAVVLGIAGAALTFQAQAFVRGLWDGAIYAAFGLTIAILMEGRRSAWAPVGLAVVMAVLTFL